MTRVRSPAYPSYHLSEAIDFISKVHGEDRQHPVPREVAARHMGFSGTTGTSDRALSSVLQYGLAEKVAKGEIRVTDLALSILHPHDENERKESLNTAAFNPQLFRELRQRYPGRPPAQPTLTSYLTREGFAAAATGPAAKAFLETCRFLQQEGAYEVREESTAPASDPSTELAPEASTRTAHQPSPSGGNVRATAGLRSDVFTLQGGGEVIATLPESMSQRDYDDLKDWLELMQRKAERKVVKNLPPHTHESPLAEWSHD
ncbi:hypothetical protein [uncultured Sphingomonas sp.]|uniref:hypothetical protein n=1 Tax=uncultured Sphingomonas sp. TaxID=158754 RepID=UPI0025CDEA18|nr:hypothetical protein [uncultured Sphingomonas sp.]